MPDEPTDPLPALIAQIDQAMKMAPAFASYARALFDAFMDEGFTEDHSLRLTMNQIKFD